MNSIFQDAIIRADHEIRMTSCITYRSRIETSVQLWLTLCGISGAILDIGTLMGDWVGIRIKDPQDVIVRKPITVSGLRWNVAAYGSRCRVGCEDHDYAEWEECWEYIADRNEAGDIGAAWWALIESLRDIRSYR